jgi:hypothetical protein
MITFVLTSCGRVDLLERTVESFMQQNSYPIKDYILVDDSGNAEVHDKIKSLFPDWELLLGSPKGQVKCIDEAYSRVKTPYIFHCEDDWEFIKPYFIEHSLSILEHDPMIMQVWLLNAHKHPVIGVYEAGGVRYSIADWKIGTFGMSWNPGLRRLADYNKIAPFIQWANPPDQPGVPLQYLISTSTEWYAGQRFVELGYRTAVLKETYCRHTGAGRGMR